MKKKMTMLLMGISVAIAMSACSSISREESIEYTIGISQFAEHGSLDNCRIGFLEGLAEEGIVESENLKVNIKNASADMGTASQIAQTFVADKVDLICAIATPSAQSAYNASMSSGVPVVYSAVTDPVAAQLANVLGESVGEVTGTSDVLPVTAQLSMIRDLLPDAKVIGIIYTTSEANSISAIEDYREKVGEFGFELEVVGITNTSEVAMAAEVLLEKVDCISNLTDNTVVNALQIVLDKANEKSIPVFGSEIEQVRNGCLAAEGIDYIELGKQTGRIAAQILKGEKKASEINFETIMESQLYINVAVAEDLGIRIESEILSSAAEIFDEIME